MFEIYREMIDLGMLTGNGDLIKAHFKNIMVIASSIGEFAWATDFLEQHNAAIIGNHHENGVHFGKGVIAFFQGQPKQAEKYFYRVLRNYEDIFFGLDARAYLLKIYYETGDTNSLESMCDSYRMFIKRNKQIPARRKGSYLYLVNLIRRLSRIPHFDREKLLKLRSDIENGRKVSNTKWLLEKIDQAVKDSL